MFSHFFSRRYPYAHIILNGERLENGFRFGYMTLWHYVINKLAQFHVFFSVAQIYIKKNNTIRKCVSYELTRWNIFLELVETNILYFICSITSRTWLFLDIWAILATLCIKKAVDNLYWLGHVCKHTCQRFEESKHNWLLYVKNRRIFIEYSFKIWQLKHSTQL